MSESARELWSEVAKKYPVSDETLAATQIALDNNITPRSLMTFEEARQMSETVNVKENPVPFDGTIQELKVPSDQVKDGIPIFVYKPTNCPKIPLILMHYHGGGLVICSTKTHQNDVRRLSQLNNGIVIAVEYRLLPCSQDGLAPFNDCRAATEWVMKNKETVGGHAESKFGVAGDSAGGQICCSVTNDIRGIDFQILVYPVTDLVCNLPSFDEFRDIPAFCTIAMENMFKWSELPFPDVLSNPRVNPSARKDLELSPPTLIILAQLDPLRDWGVAYAKKLRAAGVTVEEVMIEGVTHGFMTFDDVFVKASAKGHEHISKFIKLFVNQPDSTLKRS